MVLSTLQTIALIVGIAYYLIIMRNSQRNQELARKAQEQAVETRQAQLFMQIYRDFCTPEWWKTMGETASTNWSDYDEAEEKWGRDSNLEGWSRQSALFGFYEGLGVLVYRKLIDPSLVDDLLSGPIVRYWDRLEPYISEMRLQRNSPTIGEWIEFLYHQIKPIRLEQHPERVP